MTTDLDRALAADDSLTPSSGFMGRVMEAVQATVAPRSHARFPWAPAVALALVWTAWAALGAAQWNALAPELARSLAPVSTELTWAVAVALGSLATSLTWLYPSRRRPGR